MADDETTRKGTLLPLQHNEKGAVRGIYHDSTGISLREFRPVEEGKPILGDLAKLTPRAGTPLLDAEVTPMPKMVPETPRSTGHDGPVRVNSEAYCQGWERIFGKKHEQGEA